MSTSTPTSGTTDRENVRLWIFGAVLAGLVVYAFGISRVCMFQTEPRSMLGWLWVFWGQTGGDYAHGYLVPVVAGFVFWWRWTKYVGPAAFATSRWGVAVLGLAMLLYAIGVDRKSTRLNSSHRT